MVMATPYPLAPLLSHSPKFSESLSHLVVAKDASVHPLPPLICSHLELSTTHKKHSATYPNLFEVMIVVYSNSLPHDSDDVDEL
ncbi:unnamed protein product [Musa acuminata var. zebrina]